MKKYKIYGGLGENIDFIGTFVCESLEEAEEIGRKYSMAIYQGFEGSYDMMSWENCKHTLKAFNPNATKEEIDRYYQDVMNCWLVYSATED